MFVGRVQMHYSNFLSKVAYEVSNLNIVDVLSVAEFRESIRAAIPQIVNLLRPWKSYICELGANALLKLSEQGNVSIFSIFGRDHH